MCEVIRLTPRQDEILRCLSDGATNREIADKLNLTEAGVKMHVSAIMTKLEARVRTRTALAVWAVRREYLIDQEC